MHSVKVLGMHYLDHEASEILCVTGIISQESQCNAECSKRVDRDQIFTETIFVLI